MKPRKTASRARPKRKSTSRAGVKGKPEAKTRSRPSAAAPSAREASRLIDQRIRELGDWRGATLARMRELIRTADPGIVEEWKWRGTPVWSHDGIVCTGETYRNAVKLTFAHGASLPDPAKLFNSSLEGNVRRAIDIHEGQRVDADAFIELVRAAVARNSARKNKREERA